MQPFHVEVRKRLWISVLILFITAVMVIPYSYIVKHYSKAKYAHNIPLHIKDWRSVELPLDKQTLEILGTDDVILRRYSYNLIELPPVDLAIVFAEEDRKAVHPPESCYVGGGWEIDAKRYVTLEFTDPVIKGVELIVRNGEERQLILYWYKSGEKYTGNYYLQQLNVVMNQLLHRKASSVLIRLSTTLPDGDAEKGLSRLSSFGEPLFPYLEEYIP